MEGGVSEAQHRVFPVRVTVAAHGAAAAGTSTLVITDLSVCVSRQKYIEAVLRALDDNPSSSSSSSGVNYSNSGYEALVVQSCCAREDLDSPVNHSP